MALCELCSNLSINLLYPPNIDHHVANYAALEASAENCRLYKMMHWHISQGHELEHYPQLHFDGAADITTSYGENEARNAPSIKFQIIPGKSWRQDSGGGFTYMGIWMLSRWMVADMVLSVEEGDELGLKPAIEGEKNSYITGRVFAGETPSELHLNVATGWLDLCELRHVACHEDSPETPQLLARVICVSKEGKDPYLMEGNGKSARYATLSHCWGGSRAATTTRESLKARQVALPLGDLPKTFREAIQVCRKLDIPYLWIDSLCIVQDDKDDWERQSGTMGSIYYDSTLTIAATDSKNSSEGLFIPKRPCDYCWNDIVALPESFGHNKGRVYLTSSSWGVYGPPATDVANSILQSRGWVMQESYLGRRTLHFLVGQMVWTCCEKIYGQSGFDEDMKNSWRKSPRNEMRVFAKAFTQSYKFKDYGDVDDDDNEEEGMEEVGEEEGENKKEENEARSDPGTKVTKAIIEDGTLDKMGSGKETDVQVEDSNQASSESVTYVTTLMEPGGGLLILWTFAILNTKTHRHLYRSPAKLITSSIISWMLLPVALFIIPASRSGGYSIARGSNYPRLVSCWPLATQLTAADASKESENSRSVPTYYYMSTPSVNRAIHGEELMEKPLWQKGPYVPEDLVLVKGPVKKIKDFYREKGAREVDVEILVLGKVEEERGETLYRRVGIGYLGSWDEEVESIETLTAV